MSFDPAAELAREAAYDADLATSPGWWAYTQQKVIAMQADPNAQGLWHGLRAEVAAGVKARGYRPAAHELGQWWLTPNKGVLK